MTSVSLMLAKLLPLAIGRIVSPVPTAVLILLLITPRGGGKGAAYLLGWFSGILLVGLPLLASSTTVKLTSRPWFHAGGDLLYLCFALLFAGLAVYQLRRLRGSEKRTALQRQRWRDRLERFSFARALVLGIILGTVGAPKNTVLVLQALVEIMRSDLGLLQQIIVFLLFGLLGSLGVLFPLLLYFAWGKKAERFLPMVMEWLLAHEAQILLALFACLGAYFIYKGTGSMLGS